MGDWRPGPLLPPLIVHWGLPRPPPLRFCFPLRRASAPSGLIPLPPLLSSVPPPALSSLSAGLCCSSFALGLKGPLLMFGEAVPADPFWLGERLGWGRRGCLFLALLAWCTTSMAKVALFGTEELTLCVLGSNVPVERLF